MERDRSRMLLASGYWVGLVAASLSLFDLLLKVLPLRFGDTSWRIGVTGILSLTVPALLLSLLVICITAYYLGHRRTLQVLSSVSLLTAVLLLVALPLFALDLFELRRLVRPEAKSAFDLTMARAAFALLMTSGALGWIGVAGWKATATAGARSRVKGKSGVLVRA